MEDVFKDFAKFPQSQHQVEKFVQSVDGLSIDVVCLDFGLDTVSVNLGEDSFDIGQRPESFLKFTTPRLIFTELFNSIKAIIDFFLVLKWADCPSFQHAFAKGCLTSLA